MTDEETITALWKMIGEQRELIDKLIKLSESLVRLAQGSK